MCYSLGIQDSPLNFLQAKQTASCSRVRFVDLHVEISNTLTLTKSTDLLLYVNGIDNSGHTTMRLKNGPFLIRDMFAIWKESGGGKRGSLWHSCPNNRLNPSENAWIHHCLQPKVFSSTAFQTFLNKSEAAFRCTCPEDKRIRSESLSNCDVAIAP